MLRGMVCGVLRGRWQVLGWWPVGGMMTGFGLGCTLWGLQV